MLPYYLMLAFVAVLGILLCEIKKSKRRDVIYLCITASAMIVMASIRNLTVGADTIAYADYFTTIAQNDFAFFLSPNNRYRTEIGYSLINFVVSRFSQDPYVFMSVVAALTIGLRAVAIYQQSSSVWVSIYVFVSFGFFGYAMCTLRQEIAISVFLFAIPYLQNKKPIPYFLLVLLAGTFHKSLWLMLPLYFIAHIPLNWKSVTVYSAGTLFAMIFSEPILTFITKYVFTTYQIGTYFTKGRDFNTAFIPLVLFIVIMLLRKRLLARNPKNIVLMNFCAYASFLFLITIKHFIFQRVALIILPAALFIIPEILNSMTPNPEKFSELERLKAEGKGKKQTGEAVVKLKLELRDAVAWYRAAIGFILFGGVMYQMFLINMNRLLLIPYVTKFAEAAANLPL